MGAYAELKLFAGETFSFTIEAKESDGSALDLTNYTVVSTVRLDSKESVSYSMTANITDASNGIVTLSMTSTETEAIKPRTYVYDVILTDSSSVRSVLLYGKLVVEGLTTKIPS